MCYKILTSIFYNTFHFSEVVNNLQSCLSKSPQLYIIFNVIYHKYNVKRQMYYVYIIVASCASYSIILIIYGFKALQIILFIIIIK